MATPNPRRVPVVLDRPRYLLFDLNAYCLVEDLTGKNFMTPTSWQKISFTDVRALAYAGLRGDDASLTLERVGTLIHMGNLDAVADAIAKAGILSLPEQENGNGADPKGEAVTVEAMTTPTY